MTDEFKLSNLTRDTPKRIVSCPSLPPEMFQYLETYALYVYEVRGARMSLNDVVKEALHQFLKKVLKKIVTEKAYKLPDHYNRYRTKQFSHYEKLRIYIPYHTYQHIKQAIDCNYIYSNFSKPTIAACVREAIRQHSESHRGLITNFVQHSGWDILK